MHIMELNGCHVIAARSTHAVQAAMFVLELPAEIPTETIVRASAHYEKSETLKKFFPVKIENRGVHININNSSVDFKQQDGIIGIVLQNSSDGHPDYVLSMENNQLSFTCNKYSRWNEVSSNAIELLSEMSQFIFPVPGVFVIALQYVDEFFVTGNRSEFRSSIVFNTKNERVPVAALKESDFWHNHSGWFEKGPNNSRILNNLNISYYPQNPERNAIQIISAHKDIMNEPVKDHEKLNKVMSETFEMLHSMNKTMFKELLNDETLKSINLI